MAPDDPLRARRLALQAALLDDVDRIRARFTELDAQGLHGYAASVAALVDAVIALDCHDAPRSLPDIVAGAFGLPRTAAQPVTASASEESR